jgi:hypothetical protein
MEPYFPADRPFQVGWNAFIYNNDCYYRRNSFYFREWLRGWNCAFLNNQRRFYA